MAISLLFLSQNLLAQSFEEWKKQQQQDFETYKETETKAFNEFKEAYFRGMAALDKQWQGYLKEGWVDFSLSPAEKEPADPKPEIPKKCSTIKPMDHSVGNFHKVEAPPPAPLMPINHGKPKASNDIISMSFPFYGGTVDVFYPASYKYNGSVEVNENFTASFWETQAKKNYTDIVNQLFNYKEKWGLNDYAYLLMVDKASQQLSNGNKDLQNLHTWFLMLKSRYGAKLGRSGDSYELFVPVDHDVYELPYLIYKDNKYYPLTGLKGGDTGNRLGFSSQAKEFPGTYKVLNFGFNRPLNLPLKENSKEFRFIYQEKSHVMNLKYNMNEIDFLKNYPTCGFGVYLNSPMSVTTKESIMEAFNSLVQDQSELTQAEMMLRFVQTAFAYQVDQEQFGTEKWFFPTEILHYPYSDCDDRAIFYSRLVTELMGNKVVAVDYPGHVATAVKFEYQAQGDYLSYEGDDYFICDPTFVNAPVGLTMTQFQNQVKNVHPVSGPAKRSYDVIETMPEGELWTMNSYDGEDYRIDLKQNLSKPSELYVFKSDLKGNVIWRSKIENVDTVQSGGLAIQLDENGNVSGAVAFNESESYADYGVNVVENSPVVIFESGATYEKDAGGSFFSSVDKYSSKMRSSSVDPEMAAFLGFITALAVRNQSLSMSEVMTEVDKKNPGTRKKYPETFGAISTLKLIKTKENIFEIQLGGGKSSLTLDKLKVEQGARFRLVRYPSNNMKMEVINGLTVGKAFIRFDLNYVKVLATKREFVFNYGTDGSNAVIELDELLF